MATDKYKHISAEAFDELDFDQVTLLDLRERNDISVSAIPGAVNLPLDQVGTHLSELPKDKPVYVFCKMGQWSEPIAEILAERGYNVTNLDGGYNAYLAYLLGL